MKKLGVCGVSILGVVGLAHAAHAAPEWCAALGGKEVRTEHDVDSMIDGTDPREVLPDVVGATCNPRGEEVKRQEELGEVRAAWSKKLGLTEADWRDVAAYALLGDSQRNDSVIYMTGDDAAKRPWSRLDAIDQYAIMSRGAGVSGSLELDHAYFADALGPRLTETARFAYIQDCIASNNFEPVRWAMCQGDIEQLDTGKIAGELRASTAYGGGEKIRIRIAVLEGQPRLDEHAARVKKLTARDPGYAKAFELARAARAEWRERDRSDAALLALVASTEDARRSNSRKAFEGCGDQTWAAWTAAVGAVPAKKLESVAAGDAMFEERAIGILLGDTRVYLAAVAMANCAQGKDRATPNGHVHAKVARALHNWPGARGPRTATATALLTAGIEFDDRDATLPRLAVDRSFDAPGDGPTGAGGRGLVASIKTSGATATVTFKPDLYKEARCDAWKMSNRVIQIASDGSLVYDGTCLKMITVTIDRASAPTPVAADQLAGVGKGMFVFIRENTLVFASPKLNTPPTHVLGVKLK